MIDERKTVQRTPPAPTVIAEGPYPTMIQIRRTPRHWKSIQHHYTTRPPSQNNGIQTSIQRDDIASTLVRRQFDVMCLLGGSLFGILHDHH